MNPARLRDLVAAEWIKVWSLRSTPWVLAIGPVLALVSAARAASSVRASASDAAFYAVYDQTHGARSVLWLLLVFVAGSFGALAMANEYGTGLIRTTFTAVPDRVRVVAAKAVTVAGLLLAGGLVLAVGAWAVTAALLAGQHVAFPLAATHALRAFAANALFLPVCGLLGLAIGAVVRHTAPTIGGIFVGLVLLPSLLRLWPNWVAGYTPTGAWIRLTTSATAPVDAWLVFAAWAAAAAVVAVVVVRRRDV